MDEKTVQEQNLEEMSAALGGHEITDDEGALTPGETPGSENTDAHEEKTTDDETVEPAEKQQSTKPAPKQEEDDDADAVDESGKRYIPENRFKKVYGELKAKERELEALRKQTLPAQTQVAPGSTTQQAGTPSKADQLEVEILREKYPQFDPNSEDHSEVLDEMGYEILVSNPGITRLEAARRALARAKKLGLAEATIKTEARTVKQQQADSGIASRVLNRQGTQPDPSKMSLSEKEEWMKANGMWD